MRILAIETSTWVASVAVTEDATLLAEQERETRGQHASVLLPMVRDVLANAGCKLDALGTIAVSVGPGSFTGLRVGLSVAKGLAYARRLPVLAVPTLEALAWAAPSGFAAVAAVLDARKGQVYAAVFERQGTELVPKLEERLTDIVTLVAKLPRPCTVIGDATVTYGEFLQQRLGAEGRVLPFPEHGPKARGVAQLAALRLAAGQELEVPQEPRYLRLAEAQAQRSRAA